MPLGKGLAKTGAEIGGLPNNIRMKGLCRKPLLRVRGSVEFGTVAGGSCGKDGDQTQ